MLVEHPATRLGGSHRCAAHAPLDSRTGDGSEQHASLVELATQLGEPAMVAVALDSLL